MTVLARQAGDWPLVGRERERERVAVVLQHAGAGGVVLAGDAGVGKSRIGRETLRLAGDLGFATDAVVATPSAAEIPLGALAPLLPVADVRHDDVVRQAVADLGAPVDGARRALLVDDAHWLDAASATVLLHLATTGRVFVVVTVRTGESTPDAVVALWREGIAERIDVGDLSRPDTDALVAAALGGEVDGRTRRDLWNASRGNPLVLRELLLAALETDLLRDDAGLWRLTSPLPVPPPLAELVAARLGEASPDEHAALEILAIGEPLGLSTLVAMTSAAAVDAAERRGLVTVSTSGRRQEARLAHPLYGEVLRSELTALRTMAVHRMLAESVETTGARRREDALRLALWRLEGGGDMQPALMLDAARRAYYAHDDRLAERLARAALDAGAGVDGALLLGEVLGSIGRHAETDALLAAVEAEAETDDQRAGVAIRRADTLFWGLDRDIEAHSVLLAAEEAVADEDWREALAGLRATYDLLRGRPDVALAAVEPSLARAEGRPFVQAAVLAIPALAISGRTARAVDVADRALAVRQAFGDQPVLPGPGVHIVGRVVALGEAGRLDEGIAIADAVYEAALDTEDRSDQGWAALVLGRIALLQGRVDTAARAFREGAAAFADLNQVGTQRWCLGGLLLAVAYAGDAAESDATESDATVAALDALAPTPVLMMEPDVERGRGWHAAVTGDLAGARRWFETAAERARAGGAFALEARALHDLVRVGAPDPAVERLAELAERVDGEITSCRAAHAAAASSGDGAALERCADTFEAMGALLLAAEAAAGAAAAFRRGQEARRAQRAARRSVDLARRCESPRTPALALAGPAGALTAREREIGSLAASGMPSAEIARRLVVAVRTVDTHLQRVYRKLGVNTRGELAAALAEDADEVAVP